MAHANIKYQFWSTCTVEVSIPREEHTDSLIPLNSTSRFPTNTLADIPALPAAYAKIMPSHGLYPIEANTAAATAVQPKIPAFEAVFALIAINETMANTNAGRTPAIVLLINAPNSPTCSASPMDSISRPIIIIGEKL